MIENNIDRDRRDLQRARRRGVAPSSSLRRHFFALARQVKQWADAKTPSRASGYSIGVTSVERGAPPTRIFEISGLERDAYWGG